jgi:5-formyltetrahydrofolate cyclo-ligase
MSITEQKKLLRTEMFALRNSLDDQVKKTYDTWICEELTQQLLLRKCTTVHAYIPMRSEIDIRPLLANLLQSGVTVVCPKTLPKRKLENRILISLEELEIGIMGTQHPREATLYEGEYDCIIVPGLAIDSERYRLGYGGGYYDTFLSSQPNAFTIGIYYPFQQVQKVPTEPHDLPLQSVLLKPFGG